MKEVYAIFDDAQKSASTRTSCARKLKAVVEKKANNRELFEILFCHCFDRVLLCSKTDAKVERISAFFAEGVSSFTESNLELALEFLLERSLAVDKTVRFRACQTIANILSLKSSDQCEISEAICDKIVESLIIRMNDRFANVRVQAIIALKNLQRPVEADTVTSEFLRLMNSDPSNEVRAIATECILINAYTLPSLVARVRDVHKTVRISALNKLAQHVDMRHLTVQMRGMIVRHGLSDRDVTVKQAAVDLVFAWLRTFDYKVPQMLKYLGLAQNEEEIESVVFEIMASIDKRDDITSDIKKKIIGQAINWTGRLDTISPAEFVWTQLRCLYAFRRLPSTQATNAISELIPDIVEVCRILKSVPVTVLSANVNLQMSVRNLLKMGIYFDKSDTIGNKDLSDTCRTLVLNIDIPDSLIEPLMNAWKNSMENLGEYTFQLYHELVVDAQKNIPEFTEIAKESSGPSSPRTPSFRTSTDTPRTDESLLDERYHVESRVIIRTLQIIAYSLQQVIGTVTPSVLELETYESYLPFLFESLQRPDPELRSLSITCLGLLPLFSENFAGHHDILLQAASAELEDDSIRGQALQSLVDIASINEDKFKNDITLSNLLSRILNHSSGSLQRLAVEGTAKLLFSGCLTDPRLFANLMKFFFLPQLSSDLGAGSADPNESYEYLNQEESDINALLGTQARLHQALSLFFHFFLVEGQGRENTFVDSVSELCSDVAQLMRDDVIDASSLSTIYNHLCGMCEKLSGKATSTPSSSSSDAGPQLSDVKIGLHMRFSAAVCREILKLGHSKKEKALGKEYLRLLNMQELSSWVRSDSAEIIQRVLGLASKSCQLTDRLTVKILQQIKSVCDEAEAKKPLDCRVEFKDMALGLVDLVGLNDDPETSFIFQTAADEEDDDNEGDFNDFNHDEDDEDVDEDAGTKKKATRKATVTSVVHVPESARPRSTRAAAVVATLNIVTEHEEEAEVQEEEDSPEKPAKKKTKVAATTATLSKRKAKK